MDGTTVALLFICGAVLIITLSLVILKKLICWALRINEMHERDSKILHTLIEIRNILEKK